MLLNQSPDNFMYASLPMRRLIDTVWSETEGGGQATWDILRLDQLHPSVNGNKPFKLHRHLARAREEGAEGILTFGGPYSNHIHATAYAAREAGLKCVGVIRGERPSCPSPTLRDVMEYGMRLEFLGRRAYRVMEEACVRDGRSAAWPGFLVVPEGGGGREGAEGAALIRRWFPPGRYDAVVCACGTGTTLAGLAIDAERGQRIVGVSVLKNHAALEEEVASMVDDPVKAAAVETVHGHHFGGYAKSDSALLSFMNRFHERHGIPTDFVYTGKLMFAVERLFGTGFFDPGERVLCIHSGGLQGNRSLAEGALRFG